MPTDQRIDRRDLGGPFDIVGDVHGCATELGRLLERLGYRAAGNGWQPPPGRTLVLLGDLVDRGPRVPDVLRATMAMVADGRALAVIGNHDDKLLRWLRGRNVQVRHGLEQSIDQLVREPDGFRNSVREFLASLPSHHLLDGGRLVVAHAGLPATMHGRTDRTVRDFAMYGATTGRLDEHGMPERLDWTERYRGTATVVYGHTPVAEPEWRGRTIDVDTGCVFGNRLTALRYPELEIVSVPAERTYAAKGRPFLRFGPGGPPADTPRAAAAETHEPFPEARPA